MPSQKLKSRIKELRERAELTQVELSDLVDVTESTVANWESGRRELVWIERVIKLCKALNCTPEELIEYVPDTTEITNVNEALKKWAKERGIITPDQKKIDLVVRKVRAYEKSLTDSEICELFLENEDIEISIFQNFIDSSYGEDKPFDQCAYIFMYYKNRHEDWGKLIVPNKKEHFDSYINKINLNV